MTQAELATAKVHGLKVKCLIINNNYLGMVRQWQELFFENRLSGVDLEGNPDFDSRRPGAGVKAFRIRRPGDVDRILQQARAYDEGPCVVVAEVVKEDNVFPMIPSGAPLSHMIVEKPKERLAKPQGSTRFASPRPHQSPAMSAALTPVMSRDAASRREKKKDIHTISLFVKNEPGVLVRVAMVFSRRGYNIEASW